jgi:carbonic anhydrase
MTGQAGPSFGGLFEGHGRFRQAYAADERAFLRDLAIRGQRPLALFLGCSDSRVIPEQLMDAVPGELFVVRNVANLLPPFEHLDSSVGAALEFGVGVLHVRHLIVCGHDSCGGVRAALDGEPDPAVAPALHEWLTGLAPVVERTRGIPEADGRRWRRAVEENVLEQLGNAVSFPLVACALEGGELTLHGWVYDLASGELRAYDRAADAFAPVGELLGGERAG